MRTRWKPPILYILLFSVSFIIYWNTGEGHPSYYNYYVRLSEAFLNGRLYLLTNPPWLNELIPNPSGPGFYVAYPPLPAIIMMPLVALFGASLNQTIICVAFGSATVVLSYIVAQDLQGEKFQGFNQRPNRTTSLWFAFMFGFGTIFWWLASTGSAWLIAQVISVFFLFLAIHEVLNKSRPLLMGFLLGASYWCRLPTILGILFFAGLIIYRQPENGLTQKIRSSIRSMLRLTVGVVFFIACDMLYNYVRFGSPLDVGYWMIPGILDEPWFSHGLFSLQYIPENLKAFFMGLPKLTLQPPYLIAPLTGLAIWFTTPAFLFALRSDYKNATNIAAWLSIVAISFVIFTKGLSGWGFGYRYAVDFYPFLYILTINGIGQKIKWHHKLTILVCATVNLFGVLAFNKFT